MTEPTTQSAADTPHVPALPEGPPETGHQRIPLWIKLMWLGGMAWVLWYIISGLIHNDPATWA